MEERKPNVIRWSTRDITSWEPSETVFVAECAVPIETHEDLEQAVALLIAPSLSPLEE